MLAKIKKKLATLLQKWKIVYGKWKNQFILKTPSEPFQFLFYSSVMAYRLMLYMVLGCEHEEEEKIG